MSAVVMCINTECPLRSDCYRYRMKPEFLQSYFRFQPNDELGCDYKWDIGDTPENHLIATDKVDSYIKERYKN